MAGIAGYGGPDGDENPGTDDRAHAQSGELNGTERALEAAPRFPVGDALVHGLPGKKLSHASDSRDGRMLGGKSEFQRDDRDAGDRLAFARGGGIELVLPEAIQEVAP